MDADLLRRGCVAAGLLWDEDDKEWCGEAVDSHSGAFLYAHDDPALPAYVASLLVARLEPPVSIVVEGYQKRWFVRVSDENEVASENAETREEAIIRAALAILELNDD